MKIIWLFSPSEDGGFPNISQYRFYKKMPIRISIIYPYLASMGATLLDKQGHDVRFMDCTTMNFTWNDVHREMEDADFVVLEARTPMMPMIWKTCQALRKYSAKIVLYGDHVTWNPQESLAYCDHIVLGGNYDYGVFKLISFSKYGKTPKLANYPVPCLDTLPFINLDLVPWSKYYESWRHRDKFFWIMSMRGCYYKCVFCAWTGTFWNHRINYRSPSNVADEYSSLYNRYGECEILDDADMFDVAWGIKFAQQLIDRNLDEEKILWAMQTHPNMIRNIEDMLLLRKSGLRTVKLGVESLNQKTLDILKKGSSIKQIEKAIAILKQADIQVHANLIVGYPWEGKKEAYQTIDLIKKLNPNQAQFSLLIPYPNTELYEMAKDNGWLLVKEGDWASFDASKPMLKMQGMTSKEVIQLYKDCWSKFYLNPRYIWDHVKVVRHWEGLKQLYRGFKSIYFGHMKAVDE